MTSVLVADDDPDILHLVARILERAGHDVVRARDGQEAVRALFDRRPDLVILDVNMPGLDGWEVLERTREVSDVPVLMLTAASDELDKVRGLRAGADDFVTKPFGRQELLARVEALLRRSRSSGSAPADDISLAGVVQVDHEQRAVTIRGEEVRMTPLEYRLLAALVRNPRRVLSGEHLMNLVWGDELVQPEQIKLLVSRLRRRLDGHLGEDAIETVRGFGYRFRPPES